MPRKPPNTISMPIYGPVSGKRVGTRYVPRYSPNPVTEMEAMKCPWCFTFMEKSDPAYVLACRIAHETRIFQGLRDSRTT